MLKIFLLLLIFSCSTINSSLYPTSRQSKLEYLIGPLREETSLKLIRNDLTRSYSHDSVGTIEVTLITSPFLFINSQYKKQKAQIESITQLNLEIDQFVRYNTCFTLLVKSKNPAAINLNQWNTYLVYLDGKAQMPITIKNNTDIAFGKAFHEFEEMGYYQSSATACTTDNINITKTFTLVLHPKFTIGLSPFRLTWEGH